MKRLFDLAIATAGLAIGAPVLAVLAVAIKLDSPGPALFSQTRVGRARRPFRLLKLRTMTAGTGPHVTSSHDPRVTRIGALLRKTKLDELPQLWNVLRGEMSIVGPRPEVPRYVEEYRPEWSPLLSVRPGLTDLASLTFRNEEHLLGLASDPERAYREIIMPMKLAVALRGLERRSVIQDAAIIARTAIAVVYRRASEDDPIVQEARRRIADLERGLDR